MKNTLTSLLLLMISIAFTLQSCEKKNSENSNLGLTNSTQKDSSVIHQNLIKNYDYQDFPEFYEQLRKSLANKSELINFCDFPFNENISKEEFSQDDIISEEAKNLILKIFPEKSGEKYIIDNDSFLIQFEKNKSGNWKLKSIETSY